MYPSWDDDGDPQCPEHGETQPCSRCEQEYGAHEDLGELDGTINLKTMDLNTAVDIGESPEATRWERILVEELSRIKTENKRLAAEHRAMQMQRDEAIRTYSKK